MIASLWHSLSGKESAGARSSSFSGVTQSRHGGIPNVCWAICRKHIFHFYPGVRDISTLAPALDLDHRTRLQGKMKSLCFEAVVYKRDWLWGKSARCPQKESEHCSYLDG